MCTDAICVLNGMFPEISTVAPYSLSARANDSAAPARIAGTRFGSTTRRKIVNPLAPSDAAASSISVSSSSSTGCTVRTTKGSVTNNSATTTPGFVYASETWIGLVGPYSVSSTRPATMVGSANGRSINTSTKRLPGKSSRTRTHAINVPITTLMSATPSDESTVSFIVDHAPGVVTSCQKPDPPSWRARHTTAASGNRTMIVM